MPETKHYYYYLQDQLPKSDEFCFYEVSSPLRVSDWYGLEKTDDKFSRVSASTRVSTLLQWVILLGYRNRFVLMYLGQGLHLYGNISFLIALITKPFLVFNSLFGQVEFGIQTLDPQCQVGGDLKKTVLLSQQ